MKKRSTKLMAMALTFLMAVSSMPVSGFADSINVEEPGGDTPSGTHASHCVCAGKDTTESGHNDAQEWTAWTDSAALPSSAGYKLVAKTP